MGPLRRRNSTRAGKARSAKSSSVPASKGDVIRLRGVVKAAVGSPAVDVKSLRTKLSVAVSVVNICVAALEAQAAHYDVDAAEALRRCVSDVLWEQVEQLDRYLMKAGDLRGQIGRAVQP